MTTNCPVCGDSFGTETGVRDHAWDAHGACHHCAESFADREALYTHWLDAHGDDLTEEDRKRAERKVGDRTVCPVCDRRFSDESRAGDHAWDAHAVCHHCGDELADEDALFAHRLVAHGDALSRAERERARSAVGDPSVGQRLAHGGPRAALSGADVGRRTVLRAGAVGGVAAAGAYTGATVLGGSGSGSPGSAGAGPNGSESGLDGGTGDQPSFAHPSANALAAQPHLGPAPAESPATIVAFEDPSCPSCARFEKNTFVTLNNQLIDDEDVSFVFRGIPVVNAWGESATRLATAAMEAAYDRDATAFWSLKAFYYTNQRRIGQAVREETRGFLADRTDLDADAVLSDVDSGAYSDAVGTDLSAARDAGVRGTPMFYLFREGSFVTRVVGPQSTSVFADSLGV